MSCSKGVDSIEYGSKVYLPLSGVVEVQPLLGESVYELTVYKSGINSKGQIDVSLFVDSDAYAQYLLSNSGALLLPESMYSIEPVNFTFGPDELEKKAYIHFKQVDEEFIAKNYILPISLRVGQPQQILEEKKTVLMTLKKYRNPYQGKLKASGKYYLKYNETETEKIDYALQAETVTANIFQIPSHVNDMMLWIEVVGDELLVKESGNTNRFRIQDKGSHIRGDFDLKHQRFYGVFDLSFSYEFDSRIYEAEIELNFNL